MQRPYYNRPSVFTDDDSMMNDGKYDDPSDKLRYKWDTETHLLFGFSELNGNDDDFMVFSKSISGKHRLTYRVFRPKYNSLIKKWVCKVEYSRCYGHHYEDIEYDMGNSSTTFGDVFSKALTRVKKTLGGKTYFFSDLNGLGILRYQRIYTGPSLSDLDW